MTPFKMSPIMMHRMLLNHNSMRVEERQWPCFKASSLFVKTSAGYPISA